MTTAHSTCSPATLLDRVVSPSGHAESHTAEAQVAPMPVHTGLTNEKLESMLLFLHAQAAKAAEAAT